MPRIGLFILLFCLAGIASPFAADEIVFDRTRHKAALIALLDYNPTPQLKKDFLCQRAMLTALCRMFTREGGYYVERVPAILEIRDPETEAVAVLFHELDGKLAANATPRALQMASAVALAYTDPSASGIYAAMHAARLVEGDPDNDAIARAAYALVTHIIGGTESSRDELLKIAALNADDEKVAREIRAVPLRDWRKLPDERRGIGRFCRALHIWYRAKNWADAERFSRQLLNYQESRRFLGVIAAAWFDLPNLPEDLLLSAATDRDCHELAGTLYELANCKMLISVPRNLVIKDLTADATEEVAENSADSSPDAADAKTDTLIAADAIAQPAMPSEPNTPNEPNYPNSPASPNFPRSPQALNFPLSSPTITRVLMTAADDDDFAMTDAIDEIRSREHSSRLMPARRRNENEQWRVASPAGDYLRVTFPAGK